MKRISSQTASNTNITWVVAFLLLPFPTFITSLFFVKNKVTSYIIFGFFILFGWCFTINESTGFDSIRYVEVFNSINRSTFLDTLSSYASQDGSIRDIYIYLLAYLSKSLSDNYHVFFLLEALVFGFFFVATLNLFRNKAVHNINNKYWLIMIVTLMATNCIFNINGVRFWTASWIAVYSILYSLVLDSKKHILFLFITPLVHSTYIIVVVLYLLYVFFGKYERFWLWAVVLSFPISNLILRFLPMVKESLPLIYQKTFNYYTEQEYIISKNSGTGFTILENASEFCIDILVIYVLFICYRKRDIIFNHLQRNIFRVALVVVAFLNLVNSIPSLSGRFRWVFFPIILYLLWINLNNIQFRNVFRLLPYVFAFKILYTLVNHIAKVTPIEIIYNNIMFLIINRI